MTISPLLRGKINVFIEKMGPGRSQAGFVVVDEGGGLVKLFNVVLSSPLRTISFSAD